MISVCKMYCSPRLPWVLSACVSLLFWVILEVQCCVIDHTFWTVYSRCSIPNLLYWTIVFVVFLCPWV